VDMVTNVKGDIFDEGESPGLKEVNPGESVFLRGVVQPEPARLEDTNPLRLKGSLLKYPEL
jgi:hypothetical protein